MAKSNTHPILFDYSNNTPGIPKQCKINTDNKLINRSGKAHPIPGI